MTDFEFIHSIFQPAHLVIPEMFMYKDRMTMNIETIDEWNYFFIKLYCELIISQIRGFERLYKDKDGHNCE